MVVQTHSHRVAPAAPSANATTSTSTPAANVNVAPNSRSSRSSRGAASSLAPTTSSSIPPLAIKKRSARAIHHEVQKLGKEYHKSSNEIKARALLRNKFGITKRKVNGYNAYRHLQSKTRKAANEHESFTTAQENDTTSYHKADPDVIAKARKELEAEKEERSGYVHKTLKGRAQHADKVVRAMDEAIKELKFSCGIESLCLFVNGSNRDHSFLQAAYTPRGIEFLEGPLKKNIHNVLHDFQTFAHGGSEDLAKNHRDLQKQLRDKVSSRLLSSLQEAVGPKYIVRSMKYEGYEEQICKKYNVVLVGWPEELGNFRNPTRIGNKQLKSLLELLRDKSCRFEKARANRAG